MNAPLIKIMDKAATKLDTAVCDVCNICGDLRMSMSGGDEEDQDQGRMSARLLQQELRHMRDTYNGLKESVDAVLADHERRIRFLERVAFGIIAVIVLLQFIVSKLFK